MTRPDPAALARYELFAGMDAPSLQIVAGWLEVEEVPAGHRLTHEGARGYAFYLLSEGGADVVIAGSVVRTLGPGDFFGEIAMLGDGRQTATVVTTGPSVVLTMFGTRFRELQLAHPDVAAAIEATAKARLAGS